MGLRCPSVVVSGDRNTVPTGLCIWDMGLVGPHDMGAEFIRQVLSKLHKVWLTHAKAREGLIKARSGPGGTMAWALREVQLHEQAERQGVPNIPLN